jgi:hypothetical protein
MNRARTEKITLTVIASPMGFEVYTSLGFTYRGNQTVQVPGEEEKLVLYAMDYE